MRPSLRAGVSLMLAAWLAGPPEAARADPTPDAVPSPSASASAAPAPASAPAPNAPPSAVATQPPTAATTRRGLVVLVAGDDGDASAACRELAKKVYRSNRLRPSIDEASARALCGANPTEPAEAAALAELRRGLSAPLDGVASRAMLEAVAQRIPAEGLIVVQRENDELGASLLRTDPGSTSTLLRPGRASLALGSVGSELRLSEVLSDFEQLLGPPPPSTGTTKPAQPLDPPGGRDAEQPTGPRRKPGPPPPAPVEDTSITSSPWFWVAVGSVAALGLSILIVSQATDVDESSVRLQGRVLP